MKGTSMRTVDEVLERQLRDPAFRAEWERTAVARAVALAVLRYRTDRGLSQRKLAELLGWKQPAVARLELGEHEPSVATLRHLAEKLGLEIALTIAPAADGARLAIDVHPTAA